MDNAIAGEGDGAGVPGLLLLLLRLHQVPGPSTTSNRRCERKPSARTQIPVVTVATATWQPLWKPGEGGHVASAVAASSQQGWQACRAGSQLKQAGNQPCRWAASPGRCSGPADVMAGSAMKFVRGSCEWSIGNSNCELAVCKQLASHPCSARVCGSGWSGSARNTTCKNLEWLSRLRRRELCDGRPRTNIHLCGTSVRFRRRSL